MTGQGSRRDVILGGAAGLAAMTSPVQAQTSMKRTGTFICVHGVFAGGYAFEPVARLLRPEGHHIICNGLTGLGERSHISHQGVNLTTHIMDVVNEIKYKELTDVVLVGHSYGGYVITGAAEKIPERVASLVYVDAMVPRDGDSLHSLVNGFKNVQPGPDPVPVDEIPENETAEYKAKAWKRTPQPIGTVHEEARVSGVYKSIRMKTYVRATEHPSVNFDRIVNSIKDDPTWRKVGIACDHDIMRLKPVELAQVLRESIPS